MSEALTHLGLILTPLSCPATRLRLGFAEV